MGILFYFVILVATLIVLSYLYIFISIIVNNKWFGAPPQEGKFADIHGNKIHYRIKGKGNPVIVAINAIGSSQVEWWPIQDSLESKYRMITYDRFGYGHSAKTKTPRTAANLCNELDALIKFEKIKKPVFLVTNGTGAIYARYYAATRPEKVVGSIYINPPPLDYSLWLKSVNENEDCPNIFESTLRNAKHASKGIFRLLSPIKGYKPNEKYKRYYTEYYSRTDNYKNMQFELTELMSNIQEVGKLNFPSIPLKIVNSSVEFLIRDWARNGASEYSARQLGRLHEELSKDILRISPNSSLIEVNGTGEKIHLSNPDTVVKEITKMLKAKK